jgi:hypothetical protein
MLRERRMESRQKHEQARIVGKTIGDGSKRVLDDMFGLGDMPVSRLFGLRRLCLVLGESVKGGT